jgi:two-component system NtrC family sensor kinase
MPEENAPFTPTTQLSSAEYERKLAARDKTINVLKRRIAQEARHCNSTPFAILEQNIGLENVVARKTLELEKERHELEKALSELRFTQAQLLQAQKMESIGQLAAGIAHEINTPTQYVCDNVSFVKSATTSLFKLLDCALMLATIAQNKIAEEPIITQFNDLLKRTKLDFLRRQIPGALDESLEGLGHIAKIVGAMKEFSHPSQDEKEFVDIRDIINTTVTVARNEWKYVADLETQFPDELPLLPCLRDMISQSILNLVVNAAHAISNTIEQGIKEKGHITISADRNGEHMEVRVKDDGSGIPMAIRARIFDPFFTTKAVGKGTGQGLAIVYSTVVDKHDGQIYFESQEGVGTTFIIQLPLKCHKEDGCSCK